MLHVLTSHGCWGATHDSHVAISYKGYRGQVVRSKVGSTQSRILPAPQERCISFPCHSSLPSVRSTHRLM